MIDNRLCYEREIFRKQQIHKSRVSRMQPTLNSYATIPAKRYVHLEKNLKRRQMEEEMYTKIERENRMLMGKMYAIMNQKRDDSAVEFCPGYRLNVNQGPVVDCYLSPKYRGGGNGAPVESLNRSSDQTNDRITGRPFDQ